MTEELRWTIGMAVCDDFTRTRWTIQALRMCHPEFLAKSEVLVVDNRPDTAHGTALKEFMQHWTETCRGRYIALPEPRGTAAPRDRIFREARGRYTLCLDAHVLICPGGLEALDVFLHETLGPESVDLVQGPMVLDDFLNHHALMDPQWRAQMFGTWGNDPRAAHPANPAFEIQMHGLGLFACRTAAWPGFNPLMRGFGGEEGYIHRKFRARGGKCWCLPSLRWWHDFHRLEGTPYVVDPADKFRNNLIAALETGLDPTATIEHFVSQVPQQHLANVITEVFHSLDAIRGTQPKEP